MSHARVQTTTTLVKTDKNLTTDSNIDYDAETKTSDVEKI